mmetsp:Transcript_17984/g.38808  ORF Transcript_17984/g.38808 Transcript_17984/m.38808 type:complete len:264 (-) Transcript_17984:444-1235(-)
MAAAMRQITSISRIVRLQYSDLVARVACIFTITHQIYNNKSKPYCESRSLLTELLRPLGILQQLLLRNSRVGMPQHSLEILHAYVRRLQFLRRDVPQLHPLRAARRAFVILVRRVRGQLRRAVGTVWVLLARDQELSHGEELLRLLTPSERLHQRLLHQYLNVRPGRALRQSAKGVEVPLCEVVGRVPQVNFHHDRPRLLLRERDVHALLEPPSDGRVELPGNVGRSQHQHVPLLLPNAVHLDEELRFDPTRRIALSFRSAAA